MVSQKPFFVGYRSLRRTQNGRYHQPSCFSAPWTPWPDLELSFQAPSTFTYFPQLPTELRLKIWRFTFPKSTYFWEQRIRFYKWALRIPQPPISASINCESREETLKLYTLFEMAETILYKCHNSCYHRFRRRRSNINRDADNQRTRTIYWNAKQDTMISRFQPNLKQILTKFGLSQLRSGNFSSWFLDGK